MQAVLESELNRNPPPRFTDHGLNIGHSTIFNVELSIA